APRARTPRPARRHRRAPRPGRGARSRPARGGARRIGVNAPLHLLHLATGCYLVATVAALFGIAVRRELPRALLSRILWAGAAVHMAAIVTRTMMHGALAFTSLDEKLSAFALLLVVLFLLVQLRG